MALLYGRLLQVVSLPFKCTNTCGYTVVASNGQSGPLLAVKSFEELLWVEWEAILGWEGNAQEPQCPWYCLEDYFVLMSKDKRNANLLLH